MRDLCQRVVRKRQIHVIRGEKCGILFRHGILRLSQDALEILLGQIVQFDLDRKTALKFRNQVGYLGNVKRARRDEQHEIRFDRSVLRDDR